MLRNTLFASVACVGLFLAAAPSHAETYSGGFHCTGNGYIGNCLNGMFQMLQTSGASLKCSWYDWSNYGGAWSDFEYTIEGTAEQIQRAKDVVTGWATSPITGRQTLTASELSGGSPTRYRRTPSLFTGWNI